MKRFIGFLGGATSVIVALSQPHVTAILPPNIAKGIIILGAVVAVFSKPPHHDALVSESNQKE